MRYLALACDYDGTLATHGRVDQPTLAALQRLVDSGRKLLMVTGRELEDLGTVFDRFDLFDLIVAENGALLYWPESRQLKPLAEPPPPQFADRLRQRGVEPVSEGRVIVATWTPHETTVLETIREMGLELQVIFNKGAVMVLPAAVNKATGLRAGLEELGLSPHNTVGVGDAENDHAFLAACEVGVAVANALPTLKARADLVTRADHGAGVAELIESLVAHDLADQEQHFRRHSVLLGVRAQDEKKEVRIRTAGLTLLFAGPSGSGKSTAATGVLEQLAEQQYQFCLIDPEGDYESFGNAVVLGSSENAPTVDEVMHLLRRPGENAIVNLLGIPLGDRPAFFAALLPRIQQMRSESGRPHWLVVDETHHLLPTTWDPAVLTLPKVLRGVIMITVHPDMVARAALSEVDVLVAVGEEPEETLRGLCDSLGEECPRLPTRTRERQGDAVVWLRYEGGEPVAVRLESGKMERKRHRRKYAAGELPEERSFYFRGPQGKLNLRAQNLILFSQMAEGVDDETWLYHLRQGDYSRWFREKIKDSTLAEEAERVERMAEAGAAETRERIRQAIEERYTAPSS